MKAKVKSGHAILFMPERQFVITAVMIINFMNKYTYKSFCQRGNHLLIDSTEGEVDIVFTGETPKLEFESFCKDQLILKIVKEC